MIQPKDRQEYNKNQAEDEPPKYIVMSDFPGNKDFKVGETLRFERWSSSNLYWAYRVQDCQGLREYLTEFFDRYPAIFYRVYDGKYPKTKNECLWEYGINPMDMNDDFNSQLFAAMERYAEEYYGSKSSHKNHENTNRIASPLTSEQFKTN